MAMRIQLVTAMSLTPLGIGACAEGREPPAPTATVEVRTGLTFDFGPEGMCLNGNASRSAKDQSCTDTGSLDVQYPKVEVQLPPFAFDVNEVTNLQYQYCVAMGACTLPQFGNAPDPATQNDYYDNPRFENYPVVNVTWNQADEYCRFVGKRLPTEFEWERVAKGAGEPRSFPTEEDIGDFDECVGIFNATGCGGDLKMEEVGTAAFDWVLENGTRVYHLGANAAEWTATPWLQDVTCLDEPPCPSVSECANISNEAERAACQQAATSEGSCAGCSGLDDGSCYYMCNATPGAPDPGQSLICVGYDGTQTPVDLLRRQSPEQAYRGGSVTTAKSTLCVTHSWNRTQKQGKSFIGNFLGFRCAKDL
jgi:formylglycine-generating enzyme required for sulfatase activity